MSLSELHREFASQTATISWTELQRFFAAGKAIFVAPDLDLVDIAVKIKRDQSGDIKALMDAKKLYPVDDNTAKYWLENNTDVWAVVVAPWVLVQEKATKNEN